MDTITPMTEPTITITSTAALYQLMSWLSPSYPVGAYTYSHGLETAVEQGLVTDEPSARDWIGDVVTHGGGFADLVFLHHAHAAALAGDGDQLADVNALAVAFSPSAELLRETTAQGAAFADVTLAVVADQSAGDPPVADQFGAATEPGADAMSSQAGMTRLPLTRALVSHADHLAYPVMVGAVAAETGVPAAPTAMAYGHGFVSNLVSACLRLAPIGQTAGQRVIAALEAVVRHAVGRAAITPLEAVSSCVLVSDICSMRHETQHTRLFRS